MPSRALGVIVIAVIASTSLWLPEYYLGILIKTLIYVALALAWNMVGGIAGQLSLGHSVFIGLGALLPAALFLKLGGEYVAGHRDCSRFVSPAWGCDIMDHFPISVGASIFCAGDACFRRTRSDCRDRHRVSGRRIRTALAARAG